MSYQDANSVPYQDATIIDTLSAKGDLFRAIFDSSPDALFLSADDVMTVLLSFLKPQIKRFLSVNLVECKESLR
jgi:hypothetical protein